MSYKNPTPTVDGAEVYSRVELNTLVDKLIGIKDRHRDVLSRTEIDSINEACNLIEHNLSVELKK